MNTEARRQWFLENIVGEPHLIVDDIHQYHVCQHPSCKKNRGYESVLKATGAHETSRKLMKRESYRLYDRKYPFDSTAKAIPLDEVENMLGTEGIYLDGIVARDTVREFKKVLTPSERAIIDLLEIGHTPHDIAMLQGKKDSGSIRWHKHQLKKKLISFVDGISALTPKG